MIERVVKVDIRTITYALDTLETVTRDGVAVRVNAVPWYRAFDAAGVVTTVANRQSAIAMFPTEILQAPKRIGLTPAARGENGWILHVSRPVGRGHG